MNLNTSCTNFLESIIDFPSINHILDLIDNDTDKGFVFERLADIIIKYKCFR